MNENDSFHPDIGEWFRSQMRGSGALPEPPEPTQAAFALWARFNLGKTIAKLEEKGQRYNTGEVAWANMQDMGRFNGCSAEAEIMHMMTKHLWVLVQWANGRMPTPDDITDRMLDIVIYTLLMWFKYEHGQAELESMDSLYVKE